MDVISLLLLAFDINARHYDLCIDCCDVPPRDHPTWHAFIRLGTRAIDQIHLGIACDGCGQDPIRGMRYNCKSCTDYDLCGVCRYNQPPGHSKSHRYIRMASPALNTSHPGFTCDGCEMQPIRGPRYRCQQGTCANQGMGFDLCSDCMEDGTKHPLDHIMLRIPGDVLQPVLDYATTGLAVVL
ncbi:hypothetical protein CPB85DRAFT_1291160 [Mucidula mucida]|nr:hypothetical protein CPB85DRAFT_1291160 [Mucidula mucida]